MKKSLCFIFLCLFSFGAIGSDLDFSDFKLPVFNEKPTEKKDFDLKAQKFEYLVVDFWASWCEPCKESLPFYEDQSRVWKKKGVLFIGINLDADFEEARAYMKGKEAGYPILLDQNRKLADKLAVDAIPRTFIFDKNLKMVKSFKGYTSAKQKIFQEELNRLFKDLK
jgi:thiol-disulfide isomerase/thioredoxin